MNVRITRPVLGGTVGAIASKSHAHRLLICAALSAFPSRVVCPERSDDIDATAGCLSALGAEVSHDGGAFTVSPIKLPVEGERELYCGESGSTLRFMLPISCALGASAAFHMAGRLPERPLSPLYDEIISHGCALSPQGQNPIRAGGRLRGGRFVMPGDVSSQFISGLLMALPLLEEDSVIKVTGALESKPYVDLTLSVLRAYGIQVGASNGGFTVKGRQTFVPPESARAEGDWSNAAFWLCAGAIGPGSVTVTGLKLDSAQGDRAVLDILERFGARVERAPGAVTVSRGDLRATDIDAGDIPDLVPALAAVAAVSSGRTRIYNAARLRIKESDRLMAVAQTLLKLGASVSETEDGLVIDGKRRLSGGDVSSYGDHRIAMAAAVAATACDGPVTIIGASSVKKSYPGFFNDYAALGGELEEVG